jgi:uncharacterized repeat protein (TIGR03803 family)
MANLARLSGLIALRNRRNAQLILAMIGVLALMATPVQAQTFTVLHTFTGNADGGIPYSGLTFDSPGILVGTTSIGGNAAACPDGCGIAYQLRLRNSSWILTPLYQFNNVDGATPLAGVTDVNGVLYGTTFKGGSAGKGTVYRLRPQPTPCKSAICYWNETVLHSFTGRPDDGTQPVYGNVTLDRAGNIYGTTENGGTYDFGTVWKLAPSGGGWTESILYNFAGGQNNDGDAPESGVIFDAAGNLYGNTSDGGGPVGIGTVYQLVPQDGTWRENILATSPNGPGRPEGTLIMDSAGDLYGTDLNDVYKVSLVNGSWIYSIVYDFSCEIHAGVTMGTDGNLYGVCEHGAGNKYPGWVFKLPPDCNQTCTPVDLHDFVFSDGTVPYGPVVFDESGNLYGTTTNGGYTGSPCGTAGCGTAWEIAGVVETIRQ